MDMADWVPASPAYTCGWAPEALTALIANMLEASAGLDPLGVV